MCKKSSRHLSLTFGRDHSPVSIRGLRKMTEEIFCYHCRRHHPRGEVQLFETKTGKRWRCTKSLVARKAGVSQRDAFGLAVTAANQTRFSKAKLRAMPHCLREVLISGADPLPSILDYA
jgi:hypothetical protein